jgi:dihydropteroate synthase
MMLEGADFIDVGGYSSRPGAADITEAEEQERVLKAIEIIVRKHPACMISIDTFRSGVAEASVHAGACMINDISGGNLDEKMFETVARLQVPYVLMHMKGNPQNMRDQAQYSDVVKEVIDYFHEKLHRIRALAIKDVIIDPGFGFSKTREQNFEILRDLQRLTILEKPILVGLSRKSMIWKSLAIQPEDALNGTTALNTMSLLKGGSILRVHDVKQAVEVVKLFSLMNDSSNRSRYI